MSSEEGHSQYAQLPRPGEVIEERYRLKKTFASGGMGVIMKAEQIRTGRDVAVKILHPHIATEENFAARFKREVQVATLFDHASIVRVYDVGETGNGLLYLVMELLEGQELKDIIRRCAPLRGDRVLNISEQFLDGLAEAHSQQVVHRDLKPSNIFVSRDRRGQDDVKILDFGIAKLVNSQDTQLTATGKITGTPAYMAPEVLVGEKFASRKPIDVYASGLIILEMLTGQQVFSADTMAQTLLQQIKRPVPIPSSIGETPLGDVLRRATAKHPDDRYADADELLQAFKEAQKTFPETLRLDPESIPGPAPETSPSLLERMSSQGTETKLEMLRDVPQHVDFQSRESGGADDSARSDGGNDTTQTMVEDEKTAPPSNHSQTTALAAAVTVLGAVVVAGIAFLLLGEDESPKDTQPVAEVADETVPAEPEEAIDEDDTSVEVALSTAPEGALIWMGNQVVGRTPVTLEFELEQLPREIRFEKDGYRYQEMEIAVTEDVELDIEMEPVEGDEEAEAARPDEVEEIEDDDPALPTVRRAPGVEPDSEPESDVQEPVEKEATSESAADEAVARFLDRSSESAEEQESDESEAEQPEEQAEQETESSERSAEQLVDDLL